MNNNQNQGGMLQAHHLSNPALYATYAANINGLLDPTSGLRFGQAYDANVGIVPSPAHPLAQMLTVNDFANEELYFVYIREMSNVIPNLNAHIDAYGTRVLPPEGYRENVHMANSKTLQQWFNDGDAQVQPAIPQYIQQPVQMIQLPSISQTPLLQQHININRLEIGNLMAQDASRTITEYSSDENLSQHPKEEFKSQADKFFGKGNDRDKGQGGGKGGFPM